MLKESKARTVVPPMLLAAGAIAVWGLVVWLGVFPASVVPSPMDVVRGAGHELMSGRMFDDIVASLFRVSVGFTLAMTAGVPLGLWLGRREFARRLLVPAVNFFRYLSPLAWVPFAVLWFGIGDVPVIFLIFNATVFPITLATAAAVSSIPSVYFRVAEDYGLTGRALLGDVTLPAIAPEIITTLRVTAGLAWVVVVAAEMIAGRDGLGFAIWDARNGLRMDLLVVGMIVIGLIGVGLDRLIVRLSRIPSVRWGYER